MELTLNLVWVCVAIAGILALVAALSRAKAFSDEHASTRQKMVAMCCALVILFFVISMTDDLHGQAILFEEKKPSRVLSEIAKPVPSSTARVIPVVFLLFVSCASHVFHLPAVRRPVDAAQVLNVASCFSEAVDGRAPPLWLA